MAGFASVWDLLCLAINARALQGFLHRLPRLLLLLHSHAYVDRFCSCIGQ